jgi:hypothetical protein
VPPDPATNWLHKLYAVAAGPPAYREDICAAVFDAAAIAQPGDARVFLELAARLTPRQPELHLRWTRQLQHRSALELAIAMCNAAFAADGDLPSCTAPAASC